ncbi:unnamed protein product [Diplocarpon coronariae]
MPSPHRSIDGTPSSPVWSGLWEAHAHARALGQYCPLYTGDDSPLLLRQTRYGTDLGFSPTAYRLLPYRHLQLHLHLHLHLHASSTLPPEYSSSWLTGAGSQGTRAVRHAHITHRLTHAALAYVAKPACHGGEGARRSRGGGETSRKIRSESRTTKCAVYAPSPLLRPNVRGAITARITLPRVDSHESTPRQTRGDRSADVVRLSAGRFCRAASPTDADPDAALAGPVSVAPRWARKLLGTLAGRAE